VRTYELFIDIKYIAEQFPVPVFCSGTIENILGSSASPGVTMLTREGAGAKKSGPSTGPPIVLES
jgi:hypothetical protein